MIRFEKLIKTLEKFCPSHYAEKDDVIGVQVSLPKKQYIRKILISLDANDEVIRKAIENNCNLIITHHPLLWPKRRIALNSLLTRSKYEKLKKAKIALYTMHTNYDELYLKRDLMKLINPTGKIDNHLPLIASSKLKTATNLSDFLKKIKTLFKINRCFYYGSLTQKINTIALAPGAGGFALKALQNQKIDLLITGEMKWSHWIRAEEFKQSVVVVGHQMEENFTFQLQKYLLRIWKSQKNKPPLLVHEHGTICKNY